jgi:hypothetical protein
VVKKTTLSLQEAYILVEEMSGQANSSYGPCEGKKQTGT